MELNISPAALSAVASGNLANALVAMTPGGIEAQERRGQQEQAQKQTLPRQCQRATFERVGFTFGEVVDDLFVEATLPDGWTKVPTNHAMWTDLVDGTGRVRGKIFYKAAFYDRSAHAYLLPRLAVRCEYTESYDTRRVFVEDALGVFNKEELMQDPKSYEERQAAEVRLRAWLAERFPKYEDPSAYWE